MRNAVFILAWSLIALCGDLCAQQTIELPRLIGIIDVPDYKAAILSVTTKYPRGASTEPMMLGENQRQDPVEMIAINPQERSVKIRVGSEIPQVVTMERSNSSLSTARSHSIVLRNVDMGSIARLYGRFANRSVLQSPLLAEKLFSVDEPAENQKEAAVVLEKIFATNEMAVINDGQKFVMLVPKSEAKKVHPRSSELKSTPAATVTQAQTKTDQNSNQPEQLMPEGAIDFRQMDIGSTFFFYAELLGVKPDLSHRVMDMKSSIVFSSQTPLTREEAAYALETLFAWNGYKPIRSDDGLIRLERLTDPTR